MPSQHTTEEAPDQEAGIVVPLELDGLRILRQEVQADGKLRVEVIATKKRETCPHCGTMCVKQHDVRPRRKRDVPLRGHLVELVLHKRRFWCMGCRKAFTESDSACGRRKGYRYDTILCDLDGRHVLEVSAGRKKEEVICVLERLTDCDALEAVSMDMSRAFREAVQLCLPHARIVAAHFHVIQHVGKALKKGIGRWAKSAQGKQVLEGQLHLFLRNQEDLSPEEEQSRASLAQAFPEIAVAWQLKEDLRTWYATASAKTAAAQLDEWITRVKGEGPAELRKALSAFRDWRCEILAFFDFLPTRLTNGFVEGKNTRTKLLCAKRMAIVTVAICACAS